MRVCGDRGPESSARGSLPAGTLPLVQMVTRYSEACKKEENFTDALGEKVTWLAGMKMASVTSAVV